MPRPRSGCLRAGAVRSPGAVRRAAALTTSAPAYQTQQDRSGVCPARTAPLVLEVRNLVAALVDLPQERLPTARTSLRDQGGTEVTVTGDWRAGHTQENACSAVGTIGPRMPLIIA